MNYIFLTNLKTYNIARNTTVTAYGTIKVLRIGGDGIITCAKVENNYARFDYNGGSFSQYANTYNNSTTLYHSGVTGLSGIISDLTVFDTVQDALNAANDGIWDEIVYHPIHYAHIGECTLTGPLDAPSGQDCVVTVNPASGWTFRGASGVKIVDALGEPVPFIVNGNSFSFTMPQF